VQRANRGVLAIDLGTSSVKALIVEPDGTVLGRGQASYTTLHPREGFDEQQVDDWLQAIVLASGGARRFAPNASIEAIAITGQMHGTVMLDRFGLPLQAAIIWSDRRAADLIEPVKARLGSDAPRRIGGPIGTGYLALTLAWIREHRPQQWQSIARVALPVDWVGYQLTGTLATDPSNAVSTGLLDAERRTWSPDLLDAFAIPEGWLPAIVPTGTVIGHLATDLLDLPPGIPVIHAGGDAPTAAVGGDVLSTNRAMITMSTGAQVIRPSASYAPEPDGRWHTWPAAIPDGAIGPAWLRVGALLNAGRAIDWIHRSLAPGMPVTDLIALAQTAPAGAGGLLFLPYLAGERSPLLDPFARGAFIGLAESHEPRHQILAVIEGIALSLADTIGRMSPPSESIVFGGGGASPEVRQVMANVLGIPLSVPPVQDISALGAARIAAHALGHPAFDHWGHPGTIVRPAFDTRDLYDERLAIYREAVSATLPVMHRLQGQASPG